MTGTLLLRDMQAADWSAVAAIYQEGIDAGHATFESTAPDWNAFNAAKLPTHRTVAVAEGGEVLGWAAVSPVSPRPAYAGVVEHSVYVAAAARGLGVGKALLAELITSTEAAGIWTIQSSIFPENTASLRLHETAGFTAVGRRERIARMSYGPMAGLWRDTILMERRSPLDFPA
ncbi:GNAT family N-acetyltransferase [Paenarthrobacter sp. NPDC058040]|uniref:GNAT family N-acetyltransferase n=1 Tax=unclassified Paenarthrobacter TaxID=2634190 RepID=UPI0036DCE0E8